MFPLRIIIIIALTSVVIANPIGNPAEEPRKFCGPQLTVSLELLCNGAYESMMDRHSEGTFFNNFFYIFIKNINCYFNFFYYRNEYFFK